MIVNILYIVLISIILTLAYLILFRESKDFLLRRFLILSLPIWSFIIPISAVFLSFKTPINNSVFQGTLNVINVGARNITDNAANFQYSNVLWMLYWGVTFILLVRLILQIISIYQLKKKAIYKDGVYYTSSQQQVFSFFNYIFIPKTQLENLNYIIKHEKVHIAQKHSLDILYFELLKVLFWFNPIVFLLKKELSEVHEFFVDDVLLKDDIELKEYCEALMQKTNLKYIAIGNNFKQSQIKKRFMMMTKNNNKKWTSFRLMGILGIILASTFVFANTGKTGNFTSEQTNNFTAQKDSVYIFNEIDVKPEFPGGMEKVMIYLAENTKYPENARKAGVQGKVYVSFVIDKNGKVIEAKIVKGVSKELDKEALRVISSMPDWSSGEKDGKKINVSYIVPIGFKLTNDNTKNK